MEEEEFSYDPEDTPLGYTRRYVPGEWDSDDVIEALAWKCWNIRDSFMGRFGQAEQAEATKAINEANR